MKVKTTTQITCGYGNLPPGTEVGVYNVTSTMTDIIWPKTANRINLPMDCTNVFDVARQLALIDPDKRPSKIAAALENIMVDADGKPYHDEHLEDKKFFAFYYGADWCPPCRASTPDVVKFANDALPKHPELAMVFMYNNVQPGDMLGYMKEEKLPFPAVSTADQKQNPLLRTYASREIPQLVVVDRFGKLLATSDDDHGNRLDVTDTMKVLSQLMAGQAGNQ